MRCLLNNRNKPQKAKFVITISVLYLRSALRKLYSGNSEKCVVNAAIYSDFTEEEVVWLGSQHNKQQRSVQMSSREYVS